MINGTCGISPWQRQPGHLRAAPQTPEGSRCVKPPIAERFPTVTVGFNPRVRMRRRISVAERRLERSGTADAFQPSLRDAGTAPTRNRRLKPAATIVGRSATRHCSAGCWWTGDRGFKSAATIAGSSATRFRNEGPWRTEDRRLKPAATIVGRSATRIRDAGRWLTGDRRLETCGYHHWSLCDPAVQRRPSANRGLQVQICGYHRWFLGDSVSQRRALADRGPQVETCGCHRGSLRDLASQSRLLVDRRPQVQICGYHRRSLRAEPFSHLIFPNSVDPVGR
jgi:hypothetical protein